MLVLVTMVTDRLRPNAPVVNTASWTMSPSVTTTRDGVSVTDITGLERKRVSERVSG